MRSRGVLCAKARLPGYANKHVNKRATYDNVVTVFDSPQAVGPTQPDLTFLCAIQLRPAVCCMYLTTRSCKLSAKRQRQTANLSRIK